MAQKPIGPSFPDELRAAGLLGLPFSWGADGVFCFDAAMTAAQVAAVENVYTAHDPTKIPPWMQLAQSFAGGVQINSTATPALDAIYTVSPQSIADVNAISNCIANTGKFPGGGLTYDYQDQGGTWRTFPSTAVWTNFAAAFAGYVSQWRQYAMGRVSSPPAAPLVMT